MDREAIINKFILEFAVPGRPLAKEEILNYRDYGLGIKEDQVFEAVFDKDAFADSMGYMPSVSRMRHIQRGIDSARFGAKQEKETNEDIATPEEIHAILQETLKDLGAPRRPVSIEQKPAAGNLVDALPDHLKGLPEHKGTDASEVPF